MQFGMHVGIPSTQALHEVATQAGVPPPEVDPPPLVEPPPLVDDPA